MSAARRRPSRYADLFVNFPLGDVDRWQLRSADLQKLWTDATSSSGQPSGQASFGLPAAASAGVYTGLDQNYAVSCTDEADPRNVSDYAAAARLAQARAGGYGLYFTWTEEPCADWPATAPSDRYVGPWNRRTASTILVMSLTGDPATPYQDAIAMTRDLARARLLTVAGWGHTELANPSNCAIRYEVKYLTTGVLPPAGVVCAQNTAPFPVAVLRAVRRARVGATLRTQVWAMLAEIGLRRPGRVYGRYVSFESDVSRPPHSSRPPLSKRLRPWHWIAIDVVVAGLAGLVGALTAANDVVTQPSPASAGRRDLLPDRSAAPLPVADVRRAGRHGDIRDHDWLGLPSRAGGRVPLCRVRAVHGDGRWQQTGQPRRGRGPAHRDPGDGATRPPAPVSGRSRRRGPGVGGLRPGHRLDDR